jgi:ABC-type oligopeptide transport system ATPase subunit
MTDAVAKSDVGAKIEPLLKVKDLTITFPGGKGAMPWQRQPDVRAVQSVSLEIVPGETLGLVGESGSGKTTIGRAIMRFIEPASGSIQLADFEVTKIPLDP